MYNFALLSLLFQAPVTVVGFEQTSYMGMEGENVQVCIRVTDGSFASNAALTFELDPFLGNGEIQDVV